MMGTESSPETENDAQADSDVKNKSAQEAKRYRLQLREAESRLEALSTQLEGFQREAIYQAASGTLSVPSDLFALTETNVADYLNTDGTVNLDAVREASEQLISDRPGLRKNPTRFTDRSLNKGTEEPSNGPSWSGLFER
ncbi:hypothetical protein SAMN05216215_104745 [Saccharopolyspora shandongensis]|uniref:Uncharacterized protein n=2 Tax=Saccharopolyspora shandongensis TaxID=418495 RepID=A0A1H3QHD0_9PSEU|nr:hypothetical protein SAMN05216215_104745 [Saccharopolyspora shandongensis]